MPITFSRYHAPVALDTVALQTRQGEGLALRSCSLLKTGAHSRRLASRTEVRGGHRSGLLSALRNSSKLKIIRKCIGKYLSCHKLTGKAGSSRNAEKLGRRDTLKQQRLLADRRQVLGSQINLLGPLVKRAGDSQVEHVLEQRVGGITLRELCLAEGSGKQRFQKLDVGDVLFEAAKAKGLEYALCARIEGGNMGGKDFLLETLNRIACAELTSATRSQVVPQELAALRNAVDNETITQGWVKSLIKSSKDLEAILSIALE